MTTLEPIGRVQYRVGEWILRCDTNTVTRGEDVRRLESRTVDVLRYLADRPGVIVTKEELLSAVWHRSALSDHSVAVVISDLRKAFGDDSRAPRYIQTVPRQGYRMIADCAPFDHEVHEEPPATAAPAAERAHGAPPTLPPQRSTRPMLILGTLVLLAVALGVFLATQPAFDHGDNLDTMAQDRRPFTTLVGRSVHPSFSPDGQQVAFAWNRNNHFEYDIYVKPLGSEQITRLTDAPGYDSNPVWSPQGDRIAFLRRVWITPTQIDCGVFVMPAQGGTERRVADCAFRPLCCGRLAAGWQHPRLSGPV